MATTAQQVFDAAMGLMDELDDNAQTVHSDTTEYLDRTLLILNVLRGELYPYSDTWEVTEPGKRPIVDAIDALTSEIGLDDYICQSVMPYGLAAHLLLDENPSAAAFFNQRYEELKASLRSGIPSMSEDIDDIYGCGRGGIEPYNEFGMWR